VKQYRLGAKLDRPDPRDRKFPTTLARARAALALDRKFYTMVDKDFRINQGNEGTCVAHAATNVLLAGPSEHDSYLPFVTEDAAHQFARQLYLESSGDATYQNGMWPRDACAKLLERGQIDSYWSVPQVDDLTTALLTFGPVMFTTPWYASMYEGNGGRGDKVLAEKYGNWWIKVNMETELIGFHEIAFTGVDLDPADGAPPYVRVQNSWGPGWGWNGTARLTLENLHRLNRWDNWSFAEKAF